MKTEVKNLWIEALRSGEYEQGKFRLKTRGVGDGPDEYCCLGVLCEVAVKAGVVTERDSMEGSQYAAFGAYRSTRTLPREVVEWAGLEGTYADNPIVTEIPEEDPDRIMGYSLAELNDNHFKNFNDIADVIEEKL